MDGEFAVRLRVEDEVVAQLFSTEGFVSPLPLCGLVTKSLFSHPVPGSNTEFVWCLSQQEGRGRLCAGGEHDSHPVKCINLPLRA